MKKSFLMAVVLVLLLSLMFVGTAFAHPDAVKDHAPPNPNGAVLTSGADPDGVDLLQLNIDKVPVCGGHVD